VETLEFVNPILDVFFSYYSCGFITNQSQLGLISKIEAESLFNNLENPTLVTLISNYNNFASSVIDFSENSDIITNQLLGYKKPQIKINSFNLSNESIRIKSQDRTLYESFYNKEVTNTPTIGEYISYLDNSLSVGASDRRYNPTYSRNYTLERDFSFNCFDDITASRLINNINANPLLSVYPNSVNSEENYSGILLEQVSSLEFLFGKISNTGDEVIDSGYEGLEKVTGGEEEKYFKSLLQLGFNKNLDLFFELLQSYSGVMHTAKQYIAFLGGYFYFLDKGGIS
jgi:hypothetical protein